MMSFEDSYMLGGHEGGKFEPLLYIKWFGWTVIGFLRKWDTVVKEWDAWPFVGRYRSKMFTGHMFSERISDFWVVGALSDTSSEKFDGVSLRVGLYDESMTYLMDKNMNMREIEDDESWNKNYYSEESDGKSGFDRKTGRKKLDHEKKYREEEQLWEVPKIVSSKLKPKCDMELGDVTFTRKKGCLNESSFDSSDDNHLRVYGNFGPLTYDTDEFYVNSLYFSFLTDELFNLNIVGVSAHKKFIIKLKFKLNDK